MINFTKKDLIDTVLVIVLLYTIYNLTTPQGTELTECRTYQPLINLTKTCAASNPTGNWTLICVSPQEAIMRQQQTNASKWLNK